MYNAEAHADMYIPPLNGNYIIVVTIKCVESI